MPKDDSQTPYGVSVCDNIQSSLQNIQITFERLKLVFKTKPLLVRHFMRIIHMHLPLRSQITLILKLSFNLQRSVIGLIVAVIRLFLFPLSKYLCKILFILIMLYMLHDLLLNVSQMGIEYITNSMGFMNTFNPAHTL